jgi:hypothetical protein
VRIREATRADLPALKALHAGSAYEHLCPADETLEAGFVAIEDSRIVGWVGYEMCVQAFFLTDTRNLRPHFRLETLRILQAKLADHVTSEMPEVKSAFAWVDANYPRTAKRMLDMCWRKPNGELLEMTRAAALSMLAFLRRRAA